MGITHRIPGIWSETDLGEAEVMGKGWCSAAYPRMTLRNFWVWCCTAERWSSSRKVSAQAVHPFLGHLTCCSLLSGMGCSVSLTLKQPHPVLKQPARTGCSSARAAPPGAGISLRAPPAWAHQVAPRKSLLMWVYLVLNISYAKRGLISQESLISSCYLLY